MEPTDHRRGHAKRSGCSYAGSKFKAAEARYADVADLHAEVLRRWLTKAQDIQWDYKNVAKNKGLLTRLR